MEYRLPNPSVPAASVEPLRYVIAGFATMILGHSNDLRGISEDLPSMLWAQGLPGVIGRVVLESRFQFDELRSATERCESFVEARSWTRLTGRRSFVMLLVHVGACADCLLNVTDFGVVSLKPFKSNGLLS